MKNQNESISHFNSIFALSLFLTVTLTSGHLFSVVWGDYCYIAAALMAGFMLLHLNIYHKSNLISRRSAKLVILIYCLGISSLFSDILHGYNISYSIKFITMLVFSFLFTMTVDFRTFRSWYIKCIAVISGISLVGYLYGIFTGFVYPLPTISNINNVSYYNGLVFFAMNTYSRGRNIGWFWEPGIFAIFVTIALLFMIFDSEKINKVVLSLLLITLLTTFSTTGYFFFVLVLISLISFRRKRNWATLSLITILIPIAALFLIYSGGIISFLLEKFPRVFMKLIDESNSTTARIDSLRINLGLFLQHPIFGSGLTHTNTLFRNETTNPQTSAMTLYLAEFGIMGLVFVFQQFKSILNHPRWTHAQNLIFLIVWIVLMNVEITTFFTLIYIIIFYFVEENQAPKLLSSKTKVVECLNAN